MACWLQPCLSGCQNPVTWDVKGGLPFDEEESRRLFEALAPSWISGVTFSGGDRFTGRTGKTWKSDRRNPQKSSRKRRSGCIQGFCGEDIRDLPFLKNVDVLVDGPFVEAEKM